MNSGLNPVNFAFDEVRCGSTFGEVAPVVPEPAAGLARPALAAAKLLARWRGRGPE